MNTLAVVAALPLTLLALPSWAQTTAGAPASVAGPAMNTDSTPLPTDPSLVTGELPSGVKYIIRTHAQPAGRAAVWMRIGTGSLNETDRQRGIAHYLEHMAFNGSANFPPGTVIKFFEDLGLTFGRHQNAFTGFDQTAYQLYLGDNKPESLDKALLFMSDVAFRLALAEKEIESERQVILEEKRARLSPQQRVQEAVLKKMAAGSLIGERLPIGTEETILGVQRQDFVDYWTKWYTPTNITVTVLADVDAQVVRAAIEKHFASEPKRPAPNAIDPGVRPYAADAAAVVTDPEIKRAEVSVVKADKPLPPTTTVGQFRSDVVQTIGSWAFNRRLAAKREAGGVAFLSASAGVENLFRSVRLTQAEISAEPGQWKEAFSQMATELQRARLHGFSEQEVADARAELISQAEVAVKRESTLDARFLASRYNNQINDGEPIMSAQQTLDLLKAALPTINAAEVSARFSADFEPTNVMFLAQLPEGPGTISESELLAFGRKALDVTPDKEAQAQRVARLLSREPVPGKAEAVAAHAASGVTSFWLPSGVRVHHKYIATEKDAMTVSVSLAAGAINESAENRGISEAAGLAFGQPASGSYSSTQLREFMTGRKVTVRGGAGEDTFSLSVNGSPTDLEVGLQMVHLLLTDPKVEPSALDRWKTAQLQSIAERKTQPQGVLMEVLAESIIPSGEARRRPLTPEQVTRITAPGAQSWLGEVVASAPIEVAIVGDVTLEQVQPLVERYLGSLPKRERITGSTLDQKRTITPEPGPRSLTRTVATRTPVAISLGGFFGPDAANVRDVRLLTLASQVINSRMVKQIREEKQLVYSIGTQLQPGSTYPGLGMFFAAAPTAKEKAPQLAAAIDAVYSDFAAGGPTADELNTARKQVLRTLDENMKQASWWSGNLTGLDYRARTLDDVIGGPEAFAAFTEQDIKDAFNRYYTPANKVSLTVLPEAAEPAK